MSRCFNPMHRPPTTFQSGFYGAIPIKVENLQNHPEPVISVAEELLPNSIAKVPFQKKGGGPMTHTLAVVDEGLPWPDPLKP
ncbi:MAG: hypothetical protein R3B47_06255 [Bacteroidia bacterium]